VSDRLEAEIEIDYTGRGTIVVGGVDISNIVRRVELRSSPSDVSEIAIVLGGHRVDLRHSSTPIATDSSPYAPPAPEAEVIPIEDARPVCGDLEPVPADSLRDAYRCTEPLWHEGQHRAEIDGDFVTAWPNLDPDAPA
jgi:hypothetical protein